MSLALVAVVAMMPAAAELRLDLPQHPAPLGPLTAPGPDLARLHHPPGAEFGVRSGLLITGLSLVALGLVAGGAGWVVLGTCEKAEGSTDFGDCKDETLKIAGWALAAPGILPLAVGGFLVYISIGDGSRAALPPSRSERWAKGSGSPFGLSLGLRW